MLTVEGCHARRRALQGQFQDRDLLLVSQPQHIFYLSGFLPRSSELARWWGLNFLLIDRAGRSLMLADNWAEAAARAAFVDEVEVWAWYDFSGPAKEKYAAAAQALAAALERHYPHAQRVAVERAHLPAAALDALAGAQVADLDPALQRMRRVKHEDELTCIRLAIRAAEAGQAAARAAVRAGRTELDVYADVQAAVAQAAGEPILLLGDFAAGTRTEAGGGPPTDNVLQAGDLMILDLFPIVAGYRADITNTLCAGEPTQAQRDHLGVLQAAMQAAEAALQPGMTGAEVYAACRAPLAEAGLGEAFFHHAGHGLGLGHPEPPYLVANSPDVLQIGDVVTVEPGAYVAGWGGARIEHDYLITADGFERLSRHRIGF